MGISPKAPPGTVCEISGSPNNLVFDHDHVTNTFRGWITDPINRSIGILGGDNDDGIENILKVLNYSKKKVGIFTILDLFFKMRILVGYLK